MTAKPKAKPKPKPKGKTYSWRMAKALEQLRAEINASAPGRSTASDGGIGDPRHARGTSDHNPCACCKVVAARDFTHDPPKFDSYAFAEWLRRRVIGMQPHPAGLHDVETRVKYVISNGRIFSGLGQPYPAGVWRPYGGANRHSQHVHVSVRHPATLYDNADPWGWPA